MSATVCSSCHRTVEIDPVKCPYCTVVQPNRSVDPAAFQVRLALAAAVGILAGLPAGFLTAPRPTAAAMSLGLRRGNAEFDERKTALRAALSAAMDAQAKGGARRASAEDLLFGAATYANQRIVISGLVVFEEVTATSARFRLCDRFGSEPFIGVDANALPMETRKELLRKSFPPQVVVVRGFWKLGPFEGLGGKIGYFLQAEELQFIGELAGGSMKEVR